jgi:hypothetical protein
LERRAELSWITNVEPLRAPNPCPSMFTGVRSGKPTGWKVEERPFRAAYGARDEAFRPGARFPPGLKPSSSFRINAGLKAGSSTKVPLYHKLKFELGLPRPPARSSTPVKAQRRIPLFQRAVAAKVMKRIPGIESLLMLRYYDTGFVQEA